ncbi:DUF2087 domain-containing protein [Microbacterium hatanonis]|uniref:DUF2087 domain-containing protein n=1 Tax=Microbacterium hatanonis TaxID=404366 RepID=A0A5C8HUT7_9MICO|nr:DUF2087 domain-containing protein [Microbacterium hatanonis]TXK09697.1 DUF2087 domain-containing protein [Microbacterium hatanonis]
MTTADQNAWRPAIAALANDTTREVYARIVLGASRGDAVAGVPVPRADAAIAALVGSGLVAERDGALVADATGPKRMLATAAGRPTGIDRFLRPDGRVDRYPSKASERAELLAHVAERVLRPGEVVTERELTGRLERFADDVALLRRHLVDHGVVERTPSGSEYALAPSIRETPVAAETPRQAVGLGSEATSGPGDAASGSTSSERR